MADRRKGVIIQESPAVLLVRWEDGQEEPMGRGEFDTGCAAEVTEQVRDGLRIVAVEFVRVSPVGLVDSPPAVTVGHPPRGVVK